MSSDVSPRDDLVAHRAEIHRLVRRSCSELVQALRHAWVIGQRLATERERVMRAVGRTAWLEWLHLNFPETKRTAQRCLALAREFGNPQGFESLSVRQSYFRLGVSTEPKSRGSIPGRGRLAGHIRSSQRLLVELRRRNRSASGCGEHLRQVRNDLAPLYRELSRLFREPVPSSSTPTDRP